MILGVMIVDLKVVNSQSLKEKKRVVSSIKEKLKKPFNISIIESDFQHLWQKTQLSLATVSHETAMVLKTFDSIENFIFDFFPVEILNVEKNIV